MSTNSVLSRSQRPPPPIPSGFEVLCQRYERGSIIVTGSLPFDEWIEVFGSERLAGALLDRLTHHVQILEMNGESYMLRQTRERRRLPSASLDENEPRT